VLPIHPAFTVKLIELLDGKVSLTDVALLGRLLAQRNNEYVDSWKFLGS